MQEYELTERIYSCSIYLVGFPEAIGVQDSLPINEVIENLVPEARVRIHRIFNKLALDRPVSDVDMEDKFGIDETDIGSLQANEEDHHSQFDLSHITLKPQLEENEYNADNNPDDARIVAEDTMKKPPSIYDMGSKDVAENATSATSMVGYDFFSSGWIRREALDLLNRIQRHGDASAGNRRVILAGHGFGGIVAKQVTVSNFFLKFKCLLLIAHKAVIIANTTPRYYDVAMRITSLVFFATPHRSTGRMAWEEVLLGMLKENDGQRYRGRLSQILADLVDSVSQLSHIFYRFASKYPITNFVYGQHADVKKFNSEFEEVVLWGYEEDGNNGTTCCAIDELDRQESLRKHFAPLYILSSPHHLLGMLCFYSYYEIFNRWTIFKKV